MYTGYNWVFLGFIALITSILYKNKCYFNYSRCYQPRPCLEKDTSWVHTWSQGGSSFPDSESLQGVMPEDTVEHLVCIVCCGTAKQIENNPNPWMPRACLAVCHQVLMATVLWQQAELGLLLRSRCQQYMKS